MIKLIHYEVGGILEIFQTEDSLTAETIHPISGSAIRYLNGDLFSRMSWRPCKHRVGYSKEYCAELENEILIELYNGFKTV